MIETDERPVLRGVLAFVSAVLLGAGGLAFGLALSLVAAVILVFAAGIELSPTVQIVLSLVFIQGVGCAGIALAYVAVRPFIETPIRELLGVAPGGDSFEIGAAVPDLVELLIVGGGYLLALGGAFLGAFVVSMFEVDTGTNQAAELGMENPEVLLILIPASFLLIGPGEELLFRGVVQGRMREVFGPVSGVLIASAVFAGLHWFALSGGSPAGNLAALSILLVPAVVLGAAYEYTNNIVVPSLIHGVYNATLFSLLYVAVALADELPEPTLVAVSALL